MPWPILLTITALSTLIASGAAHPQSSPGNNINNPYATGPVTIRINNNIDVHIPPIPTASQQIQQPLPAPMKVVQADVTSGMEDIFCFFSSTIQSTPSGIFAWHLPLQKLSYDLMTHVHCFVPPPAHTSAVWVRERISAPSESASLLQSTELVFVPMDQGVFGSGSGGGGDSGGGVTFGRLRNILQAVIMAGDADRCELSGAGATVAFTYRSPLLEGVERVERLVCLRYPNLRIG